MKVLSLSDHGLTFDAMFFEAQKPARIVLFAAGSGGNPERHVPLMTSLAEHGCNVVAPHFDRLASPRPTEEELLRRARRLRLALDAAARPGLSVMGVGHSIGATTLLALAGGQLWLGIGQKIAIETDDRLKRLV